MYEKSRNNSSGVREPSRSMMLNLLEQSFVVLVLLYYTQAFARFLEVDTAGFADPNQSNPIAFALQLLIYSLAAVFMARHWKNILRTLGECKWISALVMLSVCSVAWSAAPDLTLRKSLTLIATTLFGFYFGVRYSNRQQLRIVSYTMVLVIVLSVLFVVFLPQYGVAYDSAHFGNWQGIYHQKNMLGRAAVLAVLVFGLVKWKGISKRFRWISVVVSLAIAILSGSATAIVALALLLLWIPGLKLLRVRRSHAIPLWSLGLMVAAVVLALAIANFGKLLLVLGRDATLTGRTELWSAVLNAISRKMWLGYGFNAFWRGMQGESATVLIAVRWAVVFAHNGFLDLALQLGIVGLVLFMIGYVAALRHAIGECCESGAAERLWPLMFLSFMLLFNLTDSTILAANNTYWILYVSASVSVMSPIKARFVRPPVLAMDTYGLPTSYSYLS